MEFLPLKKVASHLIIFLFFQICNCMSQEQCQFIANKSLKDLSAIKLIKKIYEAGRGNYRFIKACISDEFFRKCDLTGVLAKWWYLLYCANGNLPASKLKCRFSIEELIVFNKLPTRCIRTSWPYWILDLRSLRIYDLRGLQCVPGIKAIDKLLLNENMLAEMPCDIFKGLQLREIDLSRNCLRELNLDAFKGVANVTLDVSANPLSESARLLAMKRLKELNPTIKVVF